MFLYFSYKYVLYNNLYVFLKSIENKVKSNAKVAVNDGSQNHSNTVYLFQENVSIVVGCYLLLS